MKADQLARQLSPANAMRMPIVRSAPIRNSVGRIKPGFVYAAGLKGITPANPAAIEKTNSTLRDGGKPGYPQIGAKSSVEPTRKS